MTVKKGQGPLGDSLPIDHMALTTGPLLDSSVARDKRSDITVLFF